MRVDVRTFERGTDLCDSTVWVFGLFSPLSFSLLLRSGVGAPVIGDLDGEYKHDSRRNVLEWCLPVIDANNKSGSLEFSISGQPNDFFPVNVSFVSKRNYCDIQVGRRAKFIFSCLQKADFQNKTPHGHSVRATGTSEVRQEVEKNSI